MSRKKIKKLVKNKKYNEFKALKPSSYEPVRRQMGIQLIGRHDPSVMNAKNSFHRLDTRVEPDRSDDRFGLSGRRSDDRISSLKEELFQCVEANAVDERNLSLMAEWVVDHPATGTVDGNETMAEARLQVPKPWNPCVSAKHNKGGLGLMAAMEGGVDHSTIPLRRRTVVNWSMASVQSRQGRTSSRRRRSGGRSANPNRVRTRI